MSVEDFMKWVVKIYTNCFVERINDNTPDNVITNEILIGRVYSIYKYDSARRKISFNLSKEQLGNLIKQSCYYCGGAPSNVRRSSCKYPDCVYTGIDRTDNSKGYEIDNVVPCCKTCNYAKGEMTQEEFYAWVEKVYNHSILQAN
jgi:hypothetical protein